MADLNQLAAKLVERTVDEAEPEPESPQVNSTRLKTTPAQAAGVADHKWSLREIAALLDSN